MMETRFFEVIVTRATREQIEDMGAEEGGYIARIENVILFPPNNDIRSFAIKLYRSLCVLAENNNCNFYVVDAISQKTYCYRVSELFTDENSYIATMAIMSILPGPRTINRTFYNWFTGISKNKE